MSVIRSLGALLILAALATPALADKPDKWGDKLDKWEDKHDKWRDKDDSRGHHPPIGAPEVDPGTMAGGLTLLAGGALILADRRSRSKPQLGAD